MLVSRYMTQDHIALDKNLSSRERDEDGHLHVKQTNISKATVNPYRGSEIPEAEKLGLDANKIYNLLRDPKELEKGASTFNNKQLLDLHKPQSSTAHDHELTVGTVSNLHYEHPYLKADLTAWEDAAIAGIENNEVKQLSSSYRYTADMTPGVFEDENGKKFPYDGVMRNIRGNHVALVEEGRAGPDVVVADAALRLARKQWALAFAKPAWPQFARRWCGGRFATDVNPAHNPANGQFTGTEGLKGSTPQKKAESFAGRVGSSVDMVQHKKGSSNIPVAGSSGQAQHDAINRHGFVQNVSLKNDRGQSIVDHYDHPDGHFAIRSMDKTNQSQSTMTATLLHNKLK